MKEIPSVKIKLLIAIGIVVGELELTEIVIVCVLLQSLVHLYKSSLW
jgi:hypothetical protein